MSDKFWNRNPHDIILAPLVTEKTAIAEEIGQYTFFVDPRANKPEIKWAIEKIFDVKVASVNTQNRKGKTRRTRTGIARKKDTKRAIVTLREGTIDIYGDVL
ncbi:50S ribosomal protein L23 [Actinobaculum suis]|uniref:50S ribosomal protein L23 n=1 Tax=Actinobaculum suis TaxID=1657 RepID=UPI00080A0C08|nr:50S ribosomal protein L23 [Actinobaculum suis]OCA93439.1 50S ribosomal protein L23 [Actinobaculum suis]